MTDGFESQAGKLLSLVCNHQPLGDSLCFPENRTLARSG